MLTKTLLFISLAVCGVQSMKEVEEDVMNKVKNFQMCSACWGEDFAMAHMKHIMAACEKCGGDASPIMSTAGLISYPANMLRGMMPVMHNGVQYFTGPYTTYGRKKRQVNGADWGVGPAEAMAFMDQMETMVGNFTCVMKELGMLTPTGDINPEAITNKIASGVFAGTNKAGSDPVFMAKLAGEMRDCAAVSRSWPQQSLNKNPFMQKYGRMAIYFHCIKKAERQCCAKYVLADHFEKCSIPVNIPAAADKYDAAAMAAKIMMATATPEMKHIDDYFFGDMEM
jgi:hypothetical protein